jgi:hypothetical protein
VTYRGRVNRGVVVLEDGAGLPDGTEVTVRPVRPKTRKKASSPKTPAKGPTPRVRKGLLKLAGAVKGLPRDASVNLDHYLYGHAKR